MSIPPILFIHGAANAAWVWAAWRKHLTALGHTPVVIDLRGHGRSLPVEWETMTMDSYLADIESVTPQISERLGAHPVIAGWSMGGLLAMMYASRHPETPALALFAPSPPLEVAGRGDPEAVRATPREAFGPELYGVFPDDPARSRAALFDLTDEEQAAVRSNSAGALESGFARRQRLRGISIPAGSISCPSLVIHGDQDSAIAPTRSEAVAAYLGAERIAVPGAGHWGPVFNDDLVRRLAQELDEWLRRCFSEPG